MTSLAKQLDLKVKNNETIRAGRKTVRPTKSEHWNMESKKRVAIGGPSYAPAHYYTSIKQKISTACGGRFIQSTKVPHSIKNAFVLNRHENKTSRTIRLIINPLICHVIYRTKSIEVVKYYVQTIWSVASDRFSVTRIEYYRDYRDCTVGIIRFNIVGDCIVPWCGLQGTDELENQTPYR